MFVITPDRRWNVSDWVHPTIALGTLEHPIGTLVDRDYYLFRQRQICQ